MVEKRSGEMKKMKNRYTAIQNLQSAQGTGLLCGHFIGGRHRSLVEDSRKIFLKISLHYLSLMRSGLIKGLADHGNVSIRF